VADEIKTAVVIKEPINIIFEIREKTKNCHLNQSFDVTESRALL
jgi:hypothetical protein